RVTVAVGDAQSNPESESHRINIEGVNAINAFVPSGGNGSADRHTSATLTVNLTDGRLTIDALGGTNTKINYVDIRSNEPAVTAVTPADGATNVSRDIDIAATVDLPNGAIDGPTFTASSVRLIKVSDGSQVDTFFNTSGGGDVIQMNPVNDLEANTRYRFIVTDQLKDVSGRGFLPFTSEFVTGTSSGGGGGNTNVTFQQVKKLAGGVGGLFSSLAIGPDRKLYVTTLTGEIHRFAINADGTLGAQETINTIKTAEGGNRAIIGIAFDPTATAANPVAWVTHNGPYIPSGAADWTGKISRLSGANLQTLQDYVINLPHSFKDHMVNSLAFGPDGRLYVNIGSNSAMGAPDSAWGQRPERLLSAAVLRVDTAAITTPPLDVKTEEGGSYNPFAAGAAVTIYGSGVRNAYDLVWHSNGQLYVPTNGSAAGGNSPATPAGFASSAACQNRVDDPINGDYTAPTVPAMNSGPTQKDWLFRVVNGGYYGHPNPLRCEWVLNGGNPTAGTDIAEVAKYPVGTQPDRNYRGAAFDFGVNKSPNGVIEYKSGVFNNALKNKLLVVRYSANDDIVVLTPGGPTLDIVASEEDIPGFTGLNNPLDLIEDTLNGNLYVIEFGSPGSVPSSLTLLRPLTGSVPQIELSLPLLTFSDVVGGGASASQPLTIRNTGTGALSIASITATGGDAAQFPILTSPLPTSIAAGGSATIEIAFNAGSAGPKFSTLRVSSNAANTPQADVALRGLGATGTGGTGEPALQWILDTYQMGVNVGDDNAATAVIHSQDSQQRAALLGEEVSLQVFERADNANPVQVEPIAVYAPATADPIARFGFYTAGNASARTELFSISNTPATNGQRLAPPVNSGGVFSFDPGTGAFGFFSQWPIFSNRLVFTEDNLNTFTGAIPHNVRVYPLKQNGITVPNSYVVAFEEFTSAFDFQDLVVIVRNVKPFGSISDTTPPPAPTGLSATGGDGQIALSWTASSASDLAGYRVYRSTSAPVNTSGIPLATLIGTSYTDSSVTNGTPYYYVVVAFDTNSNTSAASNSATAIPGAVGGTISVDNLDKVPFFDRLVFSRVNVHSGQWQNLRSHDAVKLRITNSAATPLSVTALNISGSGASFFSVADASNPTLPFLVGANQSRDITVRFVAGTNPSTKGLREATLQISSSDAVQPSVNVQLAGFNMGFPEGNNEPQLQDIVNTFGYKTIIYANGTERDLMEGGFYRAVGDEVLSPTWLRANSALPVYVRQLASYRSCCAGNNRQSFQITGTGGGSFTQAEIDGQSMLPLEHNRTTPAER
ncbi:choice-of-anchor D domain-containing protein, partial [Candidatus Gracilibacteria bacterium]|nr:choice-of-anchor D domain-containing protein [Candidatus Gracilibacteria bacterium]